MAASGSIWQHLEASGSTWQHLGWQHLAAYGGIWDPPAASGIWHHLAASGTVWIPQQSDPTPGAHKSRKNILFSITVNNNQFLMQKNKKKTLQS